jgi:hypothetical protein
MKGINGILYSQRTIFSLQNFNNYNNNVVWRHRRHYLVFFTTIILSVLSCVAQEKIPSEFENYHISPTRIIYLTGGKKYIESSNQAKTKSVENACSAIVSDKTDKIIAVKLNGQGEIWVFEKGKALKIDLWSDRVMHLSEQTRKTGRWFGYLGGQIMTGGDFPSKGLIGRIGTTLLKNKYDAALSVSYNAYSDIEDSGTTSIGLILRALFRYTEHTGLNVGVRADYVYSENSREISPAVLGGINFYLPQGSFDFTIALGEEGTKSLMLGYTFFITK